MITKLREDYGKLFQELTKMTEERDEALRKHEESEQLWTAKLRAKERDHEQALQISRTIKEKQDEQLECLTKFSRRVK